MLNVSRGGGFMLSSEIKPTMPNRKKRRNPTMWHDYRAVKWQYSAVQNNLCKNVCMHKHKCPHRERGPVISLLCSSYSQSCKIQLYPVTWDHLQEMKSITKEIWKKKKEIKKRRLPKGCTFKHNCERDGKGKFSLTIQTGDGFILTVNRWRQNVLTIKSNALVA